MSTARRRTGSRTTSWRDHADRPVEVPAVPGRQDPAFYVPIGDFQGADYRRNAFAAGTSEELAALGRLVGLRTGTRVLDIGCGDGRHLRGLVAAGTDVVGTGIDASEGLIAAATANVGSGARLRFLVGDARRLPALLGPDTGTYDVAWTLCQGALGTSPETDPEVLSGLAAAVRPGGVVVATFFHALFAARHLVPGDAFETLDLVHHQRAEVRGPDHARRDFDLWTASYTAREAAGLMAGAGLEVSSIRGAGPGAYGSRASGEVGLDDPELLVVAERPSDG